MMFVLYDDLGLELFESFDKLPNSIEAIDVLNNEYTFCDENGQLYIGKSKKSGWFKAEQCQLETIGVSYIGNVRHILTKASYLCENSLSQGKTLDSLRKDFGL